MIDIQQILACLPHRYPFLLVDRVVELVPGDRIEALKNVTVNEPFFTGHFPGRPIMPGVLIVEALAQAGGILALQTTQECVEGKLMLFRGIDRVRFRRPVVPGDQLRLHVRVEKRRQGFWSFEAAARVDGEVATEAHLSAVITEG
ncbi:3-hydroxyacyl-ACP dehydratase FabZ [Deferrisoma camini]|uniref:3-hydroxyacyl-ACP dehydratase FabZ n=1 Tax=Deferrisoma camini TaxID=1035120 RepID=UPI00046D1067|nr:3-hydroxyacyl-ACP dehydratase FabZ [Deferrisoma camini]NOY44435.1 3-hydroxyacyl-ACP dehydratase FabZ [Deltaproteobacteria bacterium]